MPTHQISSFQTFATTETSNVRDVSTRLLLLEVDRTPLYVLTNNSKRKVNVYSPRIEFFEDADLVMTTTVSVATTSGAGSLTVTDATLFGVNDVVQVASANVSATIDELVLVSAVGTNTITVTRGFASTSANAVGSGTILKILGVAQTEAGPIDVPRAPSKNPKTSAAQIFEWPIQLTRTAASTRVYGDRAERPRLQMLGMRRQKLEIENAGLFASYTETLSGTSSRYTTMGLRSIISTFNTDAGGTSTPMTLKVFMQYSRFAFRYGSPEKLFMAAPIVKEALDYFAANKQLTRAEDKVFGVSLKRFVTSNGTWMIANNYNMDGGAVDEAYGIDLPSVEYCPLVENGINNDTQMILDYDKTNPKVIKDLVYTQAGWRIWHQARHSRLYDVGDYA